MKQLLTAAAVVSAVNELYLPEDRGIGENPAGVICAANEARFTSTNYNEPLTAYVTGWREPENLEALLETIAPAVDVGRRFEFKAAKNAEAFLSETDDVRQIGANFKRVEYTGSTVNEKTHNKGLTIRCDHDDELGEGWRERKAARLRERLTRNEIRRALALIKAAANNSNKTWNNSSNPDKHLRDQLRIASGKSGLRPNRVLFAEDAWDLRQDAYDAQSTAAAFAAGMKTPEQLARKLGVDLVEIVKAKFQNSATESDKKTVQTALTVLMYLAQSNVDKDDPSNVKRFVTPTLSGRWRVYVVEHEKYTDITVEHYSNTVITSTLGIEQLTVAAS